MGLTETIARGVALVGGAMILLRRNQNVRTGSVFGPKPQIPAAFPQRIPTLKMPTAHGWHDGRTPVAADGLKVNAFASGLKHPRQLHVLPNGDVLTASSLSPASPPKSPFDVAMSATMARAGATGPSPNRIMLLRDRDGDGVAEVQGTFLSGLNQPYGIALQGSTLYVGNTDGVVAYDYVDGAERLTTAPRSILKTPPGGHWTRNLLLSPDGTKLYVAVGSVGNIGEGGIAAEAGRAAIHEVDLATGASRQFAGGLRNPVGMAWSPDGVLWTVVNERDGLGDETPPDYLTSVRDGAFYGWPYKYWGIVDERVPQDRAIADTAVVPDFALGGHTASLGLCWVPEGTLPGYGEGMAIGQHGSWNRSTLSGYKLVFVPFKNNKPTGEPPRTLLSGFLSPDEKLSYGRPVGVTVGPDKRSLLMCDDVGDVIWRITGA